MRSHRSTRPTGFVAVCGLLVLAAAPGCEQLLGIHDLGDGGSSEAGASGSTSGVNSGSGSAVGSGSSVSGGGSGVSGSSGQSSLQCVRASDCMTDQICCGTSSLTSTCESKASGCPSGSVQVCTTTAECVAAGTTCRSYEGGISGCLSGTAGSADGGRADLGFTPSNFDPHTVGGTGIDWSSASDTTDDLPGPVATISMNDANATKADLYVVKSWVVNSTSTVTISGMRPAIVAVLTTVDIQGTVTVTAGGFQWGSAPGPGAGTPGPNASGGGGGSYCGVGGMGALMTPPFPIGGTTYGTPSLTPLLGGSAGQGNCGHSGDGGGAVQIVAGGSISVRQYASINAGGFGGACATAGGSGGAILLEAPTVQIAGSIAANGGSGSTPIAAGADATANAKPAIGGSTGDDAGLSRGGNGSAGMVINGGNGVYGSDGNSGGGGGAGRIRINTKTGSSTIATTGIVSPALAGNGGGADGGMACATQGIITP